MCQSFRTLNVEVYYIKLNFFHAVDEFNQIV